MTITGTTRKKKPAEIMENESAAKKRKLDRGPEEEDDKKNDVNIGITTGTTTPTKIINEYQGYSFQKESDPQVPLISTGSSIVVGDVDEPKSSKTRSLMTGEDFFQQYISQRKPCVLDTLPTINGENSDNNSTNNSGKPIVITRPLLEQVAGNKIIQVEKRPNTSSNFGQNRTVDRQVHLTIQDFLKKLLGDDTNSSTDNSTNDDSSKQQKQQNEKESSKADSEGELYYWSTQEDTDDVFNVPCRQLVDIQKIPSHLELAGNLILSSCNLWMGKASRGGSDSGGGGGGGGASSGLHHDYHDNFYLLLAGQKRFRLLSPDCAPHLSTYGTMERIHPNGRISYVGNEARADGVPLASLLEEEEEDDDDDDDDEEEVVLGKGFDYVSDDDDDDDGDGQGGAFDETKDDFEDIMREDDNDDETNNAAAKPTVAPNNKTENGDDDDHPDSFSRINPCRTDLKVLQEEFPSFASCKQVMVDLKAGQVLYLPAGWFHEVTSYSSSNNHNESDNAGGGASTTSGTEKEEEEKKTDDHPQDKSLEGCHMALNYWYHPPDALDRFDNPYKHDFWKKEEEHRLKQQKQQQQQGQSKK